MSGGDLRSRGGIRGKWYHEVVPGRDQLVFVGSHLGYPMDRTPLGGGATVGVQLARCWAGEKGFRLRVVGSGPTPPALGVEYLSLPRLEGRQAPELAKLSEFGYARFCREFEESTTAHLERCVAEAGRGRTCAVVNDISESPDLERVHRTGARIVSIWHVDVVDYFNRIYLKGVLPPERLVDAYDHLERCGLGRWVPEVFQLVFRKQREAVRRSHALIVPSRRMGATLERCYGRQRLAGRIQVVPWGGWTEEYDEELALREARRLRDYHGIGPETTVLLTLSRISPEKGIDILLEALRILERDPDFAARDLCLFVCGEPAFMRGESYARKVRAAARRLRRFRVFFPGYLSAQDKQAYLRVADLFVSASVHESYGLTIVEAMRAGLPVLSGDHYGVEEILSPAFGRRVSYRGARRRPSAMADGLRDMLSDPARLKAMGREAAEAAKEMDFSSAARRILDAALAFDGKKS